MLSKRVVVCLAALVAAAAAATDVHQCPGRSAKDNISNSVQLAPCKNIPCKLKKGTDQHISITFTPNADLPDVTNKVTGEVFGVPVPFFGVDGNSICEKVYSESGEKASCPLKAGSTYTYKDSFPILAFYPSIAVNVHWALQDIHKKDLLCFEVPSKITG